MTSKGLARRSFCLFLSLEGAHASALPPCLEGCGTFSLRPACLELFGGFEENAEQGSAIVFQRLDEAGLVHQSAELDELSCSCAPFLNPVAGIGAVLSEHEPIPQNRQALELCR